MKSVFRGILALAFCLLGASGANAESGVTAGGILLGQSVVLSGPMAENGVNYTKGIKLYFDQVNAKGGVHGRKLNLSTHDDAYDPKRTAQNTQKLIEEEKVFALFGYAGTGSAIATLPLVEKAQILVGCFFCTSLIVISFLFVLLKYYPNHYPPHGLMAIYSISSL